MLPIPKTCEYATLRGERNFTDVINNTDSEECVCWGEMTSHSRPSTYVLEH